MAKKKPKIVGYVDANGNFDDSITMPETSKKTSTIQSVKTSSPSNNQNLKRTVTTEELHNEKNDIRTVKTENVKKEPEKKQDDTKTAIKKYGEAIKNSRVKNDGLSFDNLVTDVANLYDAKRNIAKSVPVVGNIFKGQDKALKTAENISTLMGTGAMKAEEGAADLASDLVFNPIERRYNYAYDLITKGKKTADENLEDLKKMQQRDIKNNQTESFQKATGYSDIVGEREKGSLVNRENLGGQIAQGLGGMVPSLVSGQAFGSIPKLTELANLTGKEKILAGLGNVAKTYKSQLPANLMLAGQSYGGGVEEALNKGASMSDARKYGLANAAIEQGTEWLTGGIPGLGGKGGIDNVLEPLIDKGTKGYSKALIKGLYGTLGEGLEEKAATYLDALARQGILGEDINWKDVKKQSDKDFLLGALIGGILNGPTNIQNVQDVRNERMQNGNINNNINNLVSSDEQVRAINDIAQQKENGQIDVQEANQRIADVQNGTYQQNQNNQAVIQEAQRQFNAIQQAEANGQIDGQTANQERQVIINTMNQMTQPQQETQEEVVQKTPKQEVKTNDNKTERVETPKIKVKNNVEVGKQYTYQKDGNSIKYEVQEIRDDGNVKIKINSSSDPSLVGRTVVLKNGNITKNSQEYKSNIKYEDLSKDASATRYDKKMYAKAKNTDMDMSEYDRVTDFIIPNRAGNYSKQQILTIAEELGKKSKAKTGEELKQEAINYWVNKEPYKKTDSKTKYLKMEDFLKAYYKGAGVGTKIETQETTQTETQKPKVKQPKVEEKVEQSQEKFKITKETLDNMSKDLTKELNDAFKLNKNEAYSRTPQTAVKTMGTYQKAPSITDFSRETVIHTIMTDEAAKIDAKARYEQNGSLEENAAYIRGLLQSDKRLTKNDKALAIYTMKEAYRLGNKEIGDGIVSDLTVLDVEAGQWAQASKLMKQMTPYGQLQTFIKMVNNSVEKGNPRFKNVKITDDMVNKVLDCYDENNNWNSDLFAKNMEEFKANIQDQMTSTTMDKFNSIRMLGMLGAPRTHIRNILGNTGNLGLRVAKNFNDRVMESILIRDKDQRTRTFKPTTKEVKNYVDNLTKEEILSGNKYDDDRTELERNMKVFDEKHKGMAKIVNPISWTMNKLTKGNTWALDREDKFFASIAYKRSLQEYLTAKGIKTVEDINNNPQILANGKKFAMQQALEATYRQDSELAAAISNYVKKSEKVNAKKTDKFFGLIVEANIPFKKTPINIAKTGIEFSPIGLTNGIYDTFTNVRNGKMEMSQAIDEISKGITGLGLLGLGVLLAHNGFELTAADDDKDKKAKYDKSLGELEYSIKVGDRYYDLAWMAPASMPFYTGIELYQTLVKEQKFDGNAVVNAIAKTVDPLSSMSLLEGLSKSVKSYSKTPGEFISKFTLSSLENYVTQYVPTLFSQIANISDDKKRTATPSGKSSFTEFDKTWNNIKMKVPGLRQTLPEQTDAWGRTKENESFGLRVFNSLINPANNSKDKKDATDREIERLYYALGEDSYYSSRSLPKMDFDKYLTFNKEKYNLSNKELTEYKKTYGKIAKEGADKLIKTPEYKNATDEEKGKMLTSLYDYANQKAKEEYGKKHNMNFDDYKLDQIYSLVDAYNIPIEKVVSNKSIGQLKAEGGVTAKQRKINAVDRINGLTKVQKDALKRKFTMFMGSPGYKDGKYALVDVLNDSKVSEDTKNDIKRFLSLD